MNALFKHWITPIVMEGAWPHIKRMEFKGVGPESAIDPNGVAFPGAQREELRNILRGGAQLCIEGAPEKDYEDPEREDDGTV
jgi:hypothetical protein